MGKITEFKEDMMVLMSVRLDDEKNEFFIIANVKQVLETKEKEELAVYCKKIIWSDFKDWKIRMKQNKIPFDMRLPWGCDLKRVWVVRDEKHAEAVMMGLKL